MPYNNYYEANAANGHDSDVMNSQPVSNKNADKLHDPNIVKLLWTSGWDSTFRLLQLVLEKKVTVLPLYIIITGRASTPVEIKAITKIKKLLFKLFPEAADRILPTIFFDIHDLPEYSEITAKYNALFDKSYLGSQYIGLAKFAKYLDISDLELSIHVDDTAYKFIKSFVVKHEDQHGEYYSLDPAMDDNDPLSLFKPFRLPMLEWSKVAMKEHAIKTGTLDIMKLTWFCHNPINGEPCGICNPCRYSIAEGMEFRFPKKALMRYRKDELRRKIQKRYPAAFKLYNLIKGKK